MGTISHDAVIATLLARDARATLNAYADFVASVKDDAIRACFTPAVQVTNGYIVCVMLPDGSKEYWDTSDQGDAVRERFIAWIHEESTKPYLDAIFFGTTAQVRWGELGESLQVTHHADD